MAIDFNDMRDTMAAAIGAAMAQASSDSAAKLQLSALGIEATWPGGSTFPATVVCPDTSQILAGHYAKGGPGSSGEANWYRITGVTPDTNFTVEDTYSIGALPSGGEPTNLSQTLTWDGTPTILTPDTSGIVAGDSIRLNADGQFFFVLSVLADTAILIANEGLTIPSGATTSSIANSSRTTQPPPPPPSAETLEEKAGVPIAHPVVTTGIEVLSTSPHELPSYTVAGLPSASPAGQIVYVSNETGGAVPAFSDGAAWRRMTDRDVVSA